MIGTAELPGHFASYAASMAADTQFPAGSKVTSQSVSATRMRPGFWAIAA
jgi:hypothetical protein